MHLATNTLYLMLEIFFKKLPKNKKNPSHRVPPLVQNAAGVWEDSNGKQTAVDLPELRLFAHVEKWCYFVTDIFY